MKKNGKKVVASNYLLALATSAMMMSQSSYARPTSDHVGNSSSPTREGHGTETTGSTSGQKENADCNQELEDAKYFPLDFFAAASRNGKTLEISENSDGSVSVRFPPMIKACGKFKIEMRHDDVTQNETVMVSLEDGRTYSQYMECLTTANVYKEGNFSHKDMPIKSYDSEYDRTTIRKIDKRNYGSKPVRLLVGASKGFDKAMYDTSKTELTGFPPLYPYKESYDVKLPEMPAPERNETPIDMKLRQCMRVEQPQETPFLLNEREKLLNEIHNVCKYGSAQDIANMKATVGNAGELKDIADKLQSALDRAILVASREEVDEISGKMREIEKRFAKEKDSMSESDAQKYAEQYADLAQKLSDKYLDPAIYHLDNLMKERQEISDDRSPRAIAIDKEIKELNKGIGEFSTKASLAYQGSMLPIMKKYALTDSAQTIEDIRLKSFAYSQVYLGSGDSRGTPRTMESANNYQVKGLSVFQNELADWPDLYKARHGNVVVLNKIQREATKAAQNISDSDQKFRKHEAELAKNCTGMFGPKNPIQCQKYYSGMADRQRIHARELSSLNKKYNKKNQKFKSANDEFTAYAEAQLDKKQREDDFGSGGDDSDSFEDIVPQYMPQGPMGYNPYAYNMGGQQPMMSGMGGNPMMVNPQMPMYGQYQMPPMY